MRSWKDVPVKGQFKIIKDSNSHSLPIGEIYDYDTTNIEEGEVYDENGKHSSKADFKTPYQRSAIGLIKTNRIDPYILLTDVEIQKPKKEYFNKKLFKKL